MPGQVSSDGVPRHLLCVHVRVCDAKGRARRQKGQAREGTPKDAKDFVNFRVTGKEGMPVRHFSKDATDRPDIDGRRVVFGTEENLWRAVPESHYLVGVGPHWESKGPGESKIG